MASYYSDYIPQVEKKPTTTKKGIFDSIISNVQEVTILDDNHK